MLTIASAINLWPLTRIWPMEFTRSVYVSLVKRYQIVVYVKHVYETNRQRYSAATRESKISINIQDERCIHKHLFIINLSFLSFCASAKNALKRATWGMSTSLNKIKTKKQAVYIYSTKFFFKKLHSLCIIYIYNLHI